MTLLNCTPLGGGMFLGWTLGANNAANVFGTAVASRILNFRSACLLCSLGIVAGAVLQGTEGIHTLSGLSHQSLATAAIITVSAALTGTFMTYWGIPISTSQAVVGAILGIGLATGQREFSGLIKILLCWIGTPVGSLIIAAAVYQGLGWLLEHFPMSILTRDKILWGGLIVVGLYGSYALGANNVTNATGIFSGLINGVNDRLLALIGGLAMSLGVFTYSKRVMLAVGGGIMPLDAFTALVAVLAMSVTVHVFAIIGAPVSTSQGIVGAIIGIGLMRGIRSIRVASLRRIGLGWVMTPTIALILAAAGHAIFLP